MFSSGDQEMSCVLGMTGTGFVSLRCVLE